MEALMQSGVRIVGSGLPARNGRSVSDVCSCSTAAGCSVQSASPQNSGMIRLHVLDRSKLRQRFLHRREPFNGPPAPFTVRAEQSIGGNSVDEKVRQISSDEAESPGSRDRNAKLKADELQDAADHQPQSESTELPVGAELLLQALKAEDDSAGEAVAEQDAAVHVASDSAVEDPKTFFHDVEEEAQQLASDLGRSVEDEVLKLEDTAEDLGSRDALEADVLKQKKFQEGESSAAIDEARTQIDDKLPATRGEAQEKLKETARDGIEVLKWAAEGVVSAGKNARQGLEVAKEALDKRVKSFNIAADETKEVSSQVADAAQKKILDIQSSTSQFGEELQVNLKDKKAADELKPEHERNPLSKLSREAQEKLSQVTAEDTPLGKLSQEIQENYKKATSEDGPLAQLNVAVTENLSKASQTSRDFTARVSERAAKISSQESESGADTKDEAKETAGEVAAEQVTQDYEDERGNELLKDQISNDDDKTSSKIDVDEPQAVPSKKDDGWDVGQDE